MSISYISFIDPEIPINQTLKTTKLMDFQGFIDRYIQRLAKTDLHLMLADLIYILYLSGAADRLLHSVSINFEAFYLAKWPGVICPPKLWVIVINFLFLLEYCTATRLVTFVSLRYLYLLSTIFAMKLTRHLKLSATANTLAPGR